MLAAPEDASADLMRSLLQTMINALLSVDADAVVGAEWGQRSATGPRNATATGAVASTPVSERSMSRPTSCARAPTSRSGCWSAANVPRPR